MIQLLEEDYQVIFAHFPNPDFFGHLTGWMSEPYLFNVAATDAQIGRILDALDRVGATDSTLIILTADHGGHGFEHGDDTPEDRNVPWIIAGPGVPPGLSLGDEISVADTAPTVLWALGLPPVPSELGRARTDVFNAAFVEAMTPDE